MILEVEDAAFSYDGEKDVFKGISFSLGKGEVLCILGPNGIGKSTLIKCLINVLSLSEGKIRIEGRELSCLSRVEIAKMIGYVPQAHRIVFPFTVSEFVLMGRNPHISVMSSPDTNDRLIADNAIELVGITHLKDRPVSEISGGEYQLAQIARSLAQEPEILILDEPTSQLDFGNQVHILNLIRKLADRGISVIMTSHYPDHTFIIPQNVAIMQDGGFIAIGKARDVITVENMKHAYNIEVAITYVEDAGRMTCLPIAELRSC